MVDTKKLDQLRAQRTKLKTKIDQAKGRVDVLKAQLSRDFGCNSVAEAKEKLKQLEADKERLQVELDEAIADFDNEWSEVLEDLNRGWS
jgi:seryl-tRNA synthetase